MEAGMSAAKSVTLGNGKALHVPYELGDRVLGSLCNPYAWERSRVRYVEAIPNCPRCAKAVHRAAQQASTKGV